LIHARPLVLPDFTIEDDDTGVKYVWEHLGMLGDYGYKRRWHEKEQWYHDNDILPHEEGGGPNGTLIATRDDPRGGIDSSFHPSVDRDSIRCVSDPRRQARPSRESE
jgi:hypothetical protein